MKIGKKKSEICCQRTKIVVRRIEIDKVLCTVTLKMLIARTRAAKNHENKIEKNATNVWGKSFIYVRLNNEEVFWFWPVIDMAVDYNIFLLWCTFRGPVRKSQSHQTSREWMKWFCAWIGRRARHVYIFKWERNRVIWINYDCFFIIIISLKNSAVNREFPEIKNCFRL